MMDEIQFEFEILPEELALLRQVSSENLVISNKAVGSICTKIQLTRSEAEILRDKLTYMLAQVGFDENYEPTIEGKLIEELIAKLFIS